MLAAKDVPFIFVTGCDAEMVREEYTDVLICEKPVPSSSVVEALRSAVTGKRALPADPGRGTKPPR
jgi:hypothetical protein